MNKFYSKLFPFLTFLILLITCSINSHKKSYYGINEIEIIIAIVLIINNNIIIIVNIAFLESFFLVFFFRL
ncbi:MAG: hypothetical protein BAJALOKI1v1_950001 [Promethearchaeota archaeon]|nr:MAG: hypothetical protein BAJALOKI1v1_950001 [Candidatus Lokiarchaeota archaeon]